MAIEDKATSELVAGIVITAVGTLGLGYFVCDGWVHFSRGLKETFLVILGGMVAVILRAAYIVWDRRRHR